MKVHRVAVTGAGGQIAYSLLFRIAAGELFGPHQKVALHLLETPESAPSLKGVAMELYDCAFPLLEEVKIGSDPMELFGGVDVAFLVGAKPRGPGMERKELLSENGKIFVGQGKALSQSASPGVQVLVVGNPCNTNCLIALHNAPNLSPKQFFAMTRLDELRARYQLAHKAGVLVHEVSHMTIWGNHSSTQVPDFSHAEIRGKKVPEVIADQKWLEGDFFSIVQKRGAEVIAARGKSSAASAAHAALSAMRSILEPTSPKEWSSMGVYTEGNPYGIDPDLVFSFPFRSLGKGEWEIVNGIHFDSFLKEKISLTQKELKEERDLVAPLLRGN